MAPAVDSLLKVLCKLTLRNSQTEVNVNANVTRDQLLKRTLTYTYLENLLILHSLLYYFSLGSLPCS